MMVGCSTVASPLAPRFTMVLLVARQSGRLLQLLFLLVCEGIGGAVADGDPPHRTHHLPQQLQDMSQGQVGHVHILGALQDHCYLLVNWMICCGYRVEVVEESSKSYGQVPVAEDDSLGGALGERLL